MPYSINMNASQMEAARLEYPKALTHQSVYRYAATIAGASTTEIFLDGLLNKRLQVPINSVSLVAYDMVFIEFNTSTGAITASGAVVNGKIGINNAAGTVASIANPVAPTVMPTGQVIATMAVAGNDTFDAATFTVTTTNAITTKVVEVIATVTVANRVAAITGLS